MSQNPPAPARVAPVASQPQSRSEKRFCQAFNRPTPTGSDARLSHQPPHPLSALGSTEFAEVRPPPSVLVPSPHLPVAPVDEQPLPPALDKSWVKSRLLFRGEMNSPGEASESQNANGPRQRRHRRRARSD